LLSVPPIELSPVPGFETSERDRRSVALLTEAATAGPVRRTALLDEVVTSNLGLATSLSRRYAGRGIPPDDLRQVAQLGLLKAARGFRPELAGSFFGYAVPTIRGELRRHFRDRGWVVRPPRCIQELEPEMRHAEAHLTQQLGRAPTLPELALVLGADLDDVTGAAVADHCFRPLSLDAPVGDGAQELGSTLSTEADDFAASEARMMLGPSLRRLGARDRAVISLRFFDGLTQQEIGDRIGVSQTQVSRILSRVLAWLRTDLLGEAA